MIAERFYYIWTFGIMALAIHWEVSLTMFFCISAVIFLLLRPITFAKQEFEKAEDKSKGFQLFYFEHLEEKLRNDIVMVDARQISTLILFAIVGLAIVLMYPSELLFRFIDAWPEAKQQGVWDAIYYLNWAGIYHQYSPNPTFQESIADSWGYLLMLAIMFIERFL